jgi:hypothetical protein
VALRQCHLARERIDLISRSSARTCVSGRKARIPCVSYTTGSGGDWTEQRAASRLHVAVKACWLQQRAANEAVSAFWRIFGTTPAFWRRRSAVETGSFSYCPSGSPYPSSSCEALLIDAASSQHDCVRRRHDRCQEAPWFSLARHY